MYLVPARRWQFNNLSFGLGLLNFGLLSLLISTGHAPGDFDSLDHFICGPVLDQERVVSTDSRHCRVVDQGRLTVQNEAENCILKIRETSIYRSGDLYSLERLRLFLILLSFGFFSFFRLISETVTSGSVLGPISKSFWFEDRKSSFDLTSITYLQFHHPPLNFISFLTLETVSILQAANVVASVSTLSSA